MKSILLADHSLFTRSILKKMLYRSSYRIIGEVEDGKNALNKYIKSRPDFVLMDFSMPVMNGFDALKEIIKIDSYANIIILSAINENFLVEESKLLGAKGFLLKPDFDGLLSSLAAIESTTKQYH